MGKPARGEDGGASLAALSFPFHRRLWTWVDSFPRRDPTRESRERESQRRSLLFVVVASLRVSFSWTLSSLWEGVAFRALFPKTPACPVSLEDASFRTGIDGGGRVLSRSLSCVRLSFSPAVISLSCAVSLFVDCKKKVRSAREEGGSKRRRRRGGGKRGFMRAGLVCLFGARLSCDWCNNGACWASDWAGGDQRGKAADS